MLPSTQFSSRSCFLIDAERLDSNIKYLQTLVGPAKIIPVLKANAYGHGLAEISSYLSGSFDYFAVATLSECAQYLGRKTRFQILHGPLSAQELRYDHQVDFVISLPWQLDLIQAQYQERPQSYWLKVDLGLNRLGFSLDRAKALLATFPRLWKGIIGHLGAVQCYPELSYQQASTLRKIAKDYGLPLSLENSEGALFFAAEKRVQGDYVRLGLSLYGYSPFEKKRIQPIGKLVSRVLKTFPRGEKIMGYNWQHTCSFPVSLCAIGYGDGLSPNLCGALIDSGRFRVEEPMMMDLSYLSHQTKIAAQSVTWFGEEQQDLLSLARYLKVKPYVLLSQLQSRLERVMINSSSQLRL